MSKCVYYCGKRKTVGKLWSRPNPLLTSGSGVRKRHATQPVLTSPSSQYAPKVISISSITIGQIGRTSWDARKTLLLLLSSVVSCRCELMRNDCNAALFTSSRYVCGLMSAFSELVVGQRRFDEPSNNGFPTCVNQTLIDRPDWYPKSIKFTSFLKYAAKSHFLIVRKINFLCRCSRHYCYLVSFEFLSIFLISDFRLSSMEASKEIVDSHGRRVTTMVRFS